MGKLWTAGAMAGAGVAGYVGLITGVVPIDVGVGRRTPLGPLTVDIARCARRGVRRARRAVIWAGRLGPWPRKIHVLERGTDMVLAAHRTAIRGRLVAITVETVRFTRPERVDFRLVRGPVPLVVEQFVLRRGDGGTELTYTGN